ncbi:hypothetical protein HBI74_065280 [Parastagonospora nodorum]|nr:hypothetical protein HBI74_065280 [Parastagonospora nodorum]
MGQNSSQVVPGSDSQARTCLLQTSPDDEYKPRYTPTMDDFLASQQLMEEGARAEHATSDARGRSPTPDDMADGAGEEQPIDLTTQPPAPSQQTIPSSPPFAALHKPLSLLLTGEDPAASQFTGDEGAPQPQSDVEVPDSQLAPASPRLPITPAATSSFAIPATPQEGPTQKKKKKRSGKSRQSLLAEVNSLNSVLSQGTPSNDKENTTAMAVDNPPASAPRTKRKRKKTYITPPPTTPGSERAAAARGQDISAMPFANVIAGAEGAPTPIKRVNKKKRGSLIQALQESARDESANGDNAIAQSEIVEGRLKSVEGRLRKFKRSKPPLSAMLSDDEVDRTLEVVETPSIRKKPKKSRQSSSTKASTSKNTEEVVEAPPASKKRKRKSKAKDAEVLDQDASGATNQPDANLMQQDPLADEENMQNASSSEKATPKSTKEKKPMLPPLTNTPARRYVRKSTVDLSKYAADRELNNNRNLNHPPVLPESGRFTQDEDEILRRAISDYQQRNNLSTVDLVAVIQWTDPSQDPWNTWNKRKKSEWDAQQLEDEAESKEFWQEILHTEPQLRRKPEIIKGHVQARYHTFKSGGWTEEEEEMLKELMEKHPNQWKTISLIMPDRSAADIHNRWKDYVQYGEQRNTARWTRAEEESLVSALTTVIQRDEDERDEMGLPSVAEYTNKDINWSAVCELMGKVRSRLQCTVKWTQMKKRDASVNIRPVYKRGRTPDPTRPAAPTPKPKPKKRKSEANGDGTELRKKRGRPRKSEVYVDKDDLGLHEANPDAVEPEGDFNSSVASKEPKKSRAKRFKAQGLVENVDETDDESLATTTSQKRCQSTRTSKKTAEAAIREAPGQDVMAPEEDADEVASKEANDEVTAPPEEDEEQDVAVPDHDDDEAASEEVNDEDATAPQGDDEVAASEEINAGSIATPEEHADQLEVAPEVSGQVASEELDEDDIPSPFDFDYGHEVAAAEQDVELEVSILEEDIDQEEEAVKEHDAHEVLTPVQHDDELATPEDEEVQEEAVVEVYDPSEPSDSVRQEEISAASQMSKSSTLKTPQQPRRSVQVPPGVGHMKWGDKLDIIEALAFDSDITDVDDVVWHELADLLESKWSPSDLETEVKELLTLVPDQGTWARTLKALRRHLENNVEQDKLSEHYDPFDGPFDDGEVNAGLQEETESRTEANEPNSKKKRKRNAHDKSTESRPGKKKRKKRSSMPKTPANKSTTSVAKSG